MKCPIIVFKTVSYQHSSWNHTSGQVKDALLAFIEVPLGKLQTLLVTILMNLLVTLQKTQLMSTAQLELILWFSEFI